MIYIFSTIIGLCFFIVPILSYREGIRQGMQISKGIEPPKLRSPVEVVKAIKAEHEQAKEDKKFSKDLDIMLNYTGGDEDGAD